MFSLGLAVPVVFPGWGGRWQRGACCCPSIPSQHSFCPEEFPDATWGLDMVVGQRSPVRL